MNGQIRRVFLFVAAGVLSFVVGCSSSTTATTTQPSQPQQQTGGVNVLISDDPTEDWATIGVKVLSVAVVPQGGGTPVTIFTAPSTPPMINLVQLDQLGEIIGNATIPTGTYTSVNVTLGANNSGSSCDVSLVVSADPETGFDLPPGTSVPCSEIAITGAQGTAPNMTVPLSLKLDDPLTVITTGSNALDLEFDLAHPAFIVEHFPVGATSPMWAVNFNGPVRHRPHPDLTKVILRHTYGQVQSVSSDNTSITIARAFPEHPVTNPETADVDADDKLSILADSVNGTLYYDLDNSSAPSTITSFSTVASQLAANPYVRIAARYQQNGTLVATRIYASQTFDKVWQNPEGHILHINTTTNIMHVTTEDGSAKAIAIGPNTAFYFGSNNTVIGTGTAFFDGVTPGNLPNIARGFKVNVTIDPLSASKPPVALSVEIDVARYDGAITQPNNTDFTYTRTFAMADSRAGKDNYSGYIAYATGPETDQQGNSVTGFYWWNFGFPTLEDTGSSAVGDFVKATAGTVNFGGVVGALKPRGLSNATWNDPGAANTWAARWAILTPVGAPVGKISTAFSTTTDSFAFTVPLPATAAQSTPAAQPVTVDLTTASGSAPLVYQVDRQGGIITITPQDISNASTLAAVAADLVVGVPVKVFGVPQADGSIKAYVLLYYTHTPSSK